MDFFQGQYPKRLSINYVAINKESVNNHYSCIRLRYEFVLIRVTMTSKGTLLPKSFRRAFFSNGRLDVREVQPKSIRTLSRYFGMKFLWLEKR